MPEAERGASIEARGVRVRFPDQPTDAVAGLDLSIDAGELVVLLGPSGCGKSTFLRTINRLIEPEEGTIAIDGVDVREIDRVALRRSIGYVIQAVGLFPHMTVAENVALVPKLLHWEPDRIGARVDELLALVRLDPQRYRRQLPRALSGGQQQRVGVARALAAHPHILLMDEPFAAVDAIVRVALQDELAAIHAALGTTIVFVTHDVHEALRLANRIAVMNEGRVVQYDTPLRVLAHPASPFVAELLDAHDVTRRLALLRAGDAMRPSPEPPVAHAISADASLRDALNALLTGNGRVDVMRNGTRAGTIAFDDVRRALAQSA